MLSFGMEAQIITTIAGCDTIGTVIWNGDNGLAIYAGFHSPTSLCMGHNSNIYIGDELEGRIRKIDMDGIVTTIAGNGISGYRGDDSLATNAELCDIGYISLGPDGNIYIPDVCNNRIRKLDLSSGIITTVVGTGVLGFAGDNDSLALEAEIAYPFGICFDLSGKLVFSEGGNRILKIDSSGLITRIAGADSTGGYSGDGGPAINAVFNHPVDIAYDHEGNLYVNDLGNDVIRKIDTFGTITNFAGTGSWGYSGDHGSATNAKLNGPEGIAIDGAGNIFFGDQLNFVVRRIDHVTNIITTVAGTGIEGFSGDGNMATNAKMDRTAGVSFDSLGNLYIADAGNNRIRKVTNVGVPLKSKEVQNSAPQISLYPNPAKDQVFIMGVEKGDVSVFDLLGRKRKTVAVNSTKQAMGIGDLEPGVYIVQVHDFPSGSIASIRLLNE